MNNKSKAKLGNNFAPVRITISPWGSRKHLAKLHNVCMCVYRRK